MRRAIIAVTAGIAAVLVTADITDAKPRHHRHPRLTAESSEVVKHPAGCPWHLFCGCGTSVYFFGYPVPGLFLASNWGVKFRHVEPGPRTAAYRSGHVMAVITVNGDTATVYNPNSGGHLTREQTVSISALRRAGYRFVDPFSSKTAALR
jgi:hypothetical protein